jgi:hypothetical protein
MEAAVYRDALSVRPMYRAPQMVVDRRQRSPTVVALSEPLIPLRPLSTEDEEPLRVDVRTALDLRLRDRALKDAGSRLPERLGEWLPYSAPEQAEDGLAVPIARPDLAPRSEDRACALERGTEHPRNVRL